MVRLSTKNKVTIRTIIQTIVGLAVVAPILVDQVGGTEAAGWLAGVVAVAGVVTRFMASTCAIEPPPAPISTISITGIRTGRPEPLRKRAARSTSNTREVSG